jgi:osmotically inducible protein OsmC
MKRIAHAQWTGTLKDGSGHLTTASHTLANTPYSFTARFEDGQGTNPEELLAAAHAGCFTMALSAQLTTAGFTPESLATQCTITLEKLESGFTITASDLVLTAKVPGASREAFEQAATAAKEGCPVSKLYNTKISLEWTLAE